MDIRTSLSTARLDDMVRWRADQFRRDPQVLFPLRRFCTVKALLVTDGSLDFGVGDFGLSAFVNLMVNDGRSYVRFDLTLAHLRSNVSDAEVMKGQPRIVDSIKGFRFDDPHHFDENRFDEVWLFGFETSFHRPEYEHRNTHQDVYPAGRLGNAELIALSAHMRRGGGVFATGDHGALGRALCGSVNRVRSMRYWDSHVVGGQDQVGMNNAWRNDTNQRGDAGSQFSDQSDDIPQTLDLKLYHSRLGIFTRERYPHPVLCGPDGRITVLPDHPHEGECIEPSPASLTDIYSPDGSEEFPPALGGGPRVSPEVVATSRVPSGNTASHFSSTKVATVAHSFGAISTYDGHRAGVGRVVCDATWHHFVNVNLIGVVEGGLFDDLTPANSPSKHDGFLSTPGGRAALAKIKDYFVNIGVWIAPPARQRCFNNTLRWDVVYRDRLMEGTLVDPDTPLAKVPLDLLLHIGTSARDVIGQAAGHCRSLELTLDLLTPLLPELVQLVDPWQPPIPLPDPPPIRWADPMRVIDAALGAGIVSLRQALPYPVEVTKDTEARAAESLQAGLLHGALRGVRQMGQDLSGLAEILRASEDRLRGERRSSVAGE